MDFPPGANFNFKRTHESVRFTTYGKHYCVYGGVSQPTMRNSFWLFEVQLTTNSLRALFYFEGSARRDYIVLRFVLNCNGTVSFEKYLIYL